MSYTDKELQKAKDVLEACNFVSPSTKGCYSSRIALWIHFCNQCCRGDDIVTEEKLADYVEWLVSSGSAERIRQGNTHVQQVLRNQLQGVLCYWRIQTGNRDDLSDPRLSPVFMAKWQQIAMRYPRPRQSRRSEPIYGAPGHNGDPEAVTPSQTGANTPIPPSMAAVHPNHMKRIPDRQSVSQRQFHYAQHQAVRPPMNMVVHDSKPNILQLPPPPLAPHHHPHSGASPHSSSMRHYAGKDGPVHVVPPPPNGHHAYRNETVVDNDDGRAPGAAAIVPNQPDGYPPSSRSAGNIVSDSPQQQQQQLSDEKLLRLSRSPLPGFIPESMPEWKEDGNTAPEGHLLTSMEAMAVNLRQLEMDNNLQYQARAIYNLGLASWLPIDNRLSLTWTDIGVDVVHPVTLKQQSAATQMSKKKDKSPATGSNSSNSAPISPTNHAEEGTPGDDQSGKAAPAQSVPPLSASTTTASSSANSSPKISDKTDVSPATSAVTVAKALSVAIHNNEHNDNSAASSAKQNKALVLRHRNPLLCAWSSLAIWFFWKWHIAKEPAPDFAALDWQSQHLFVSIDGETGSTSKFESLFHDAFSTVSSDSLDGAKVMQNKGYFYAETLGLVHPTIKGVKGLDCVDSIDSQTLDAQVWIELTKINAGYDSEIGCSDDDRKEEVIDVPGRFNVMPSQALQKEIFPWIMPLLQKAYAQSNNDQVRHATRFLRMLKDLRIVLLQDIAYLMEVPLLKEMTKTNKMFSSSVFASPEFEAYRSEIQVALGEAELKETHELCLATLKWVEERRSSSMSEDDHSRLQPTAPQLSPSEIEAAREKAMARQRKDEETAAAAAAKALLGNSNSRKRQHVDHSPDLPNNDNGSGGGILNNTVEGQTKRSRRVYNSIANAVPSPYRGNSSSSTSVTMPVAAATAAAAISPSGSSSQHLQMQSSAELVMAIEDLRMENEDLRAQMQRIELGLNQQRSEVRSWMSRIEKSMQQAHSSSDTPPAMPPNSNRYSASPGNPDKGGGPAYHHESPYSQQQQQQQQRPPMLPPHSSPFYGRQQVPQPLPVSASSHPHHGHRGYEGRYYQGPPPPQMSQIPARGSGRMSPSSQSNYSLNSKQPPGGAGGYNYSNRSHQQGQVPSVSSVASLVHQHPPPQSATENGSIPYSHRLPSPRESHHQPSMAQPAGYSNPPITPSGSSRSNEYANHPGAMASWYPPSNSSLPSVYSGQHGDGSPPAPGPRA